MTDIYILKHIFFGESMFRVKKQWATLNNGILPVLVARQTFRNCEDFKWHSFVGSISSMATKYCCQIILPWHIIALIRGIVNINFMPITKQKDRFLGKTALIASFRAITKREREYSKAGNAEGYSSKVFF
jgi:hypothetical protein